MPTDYGDYILDSEPSCPKCSNKEIGVFSNGYYCLDCGCTFTPFTSYSAGYPQLSLPQSESYQEAPAKIIDCGEDDYEVEVIEEPRNNVVYLKDYKRKEPKPPFNLKEIIVD